MTVVPRLLITAPRPSPAIPNDDGTLVLYTVSTYDLETHKESKEVKTLEVKTGKASLFTDDTKNTSFQWLTKSLLLWQREGDGEKTELWIGHIDKEQGKSVMRDNSIIILMSTAKIDHIMQAQSLQALTTSRQRSLVMGQLL